jgi:4'-phosphopantetheinyl transferase
MNMIDVYWLEQTEADVSAADDWLSADEAIRLNSMRFPKRRADWRLGRWTAKHAVASYLDSPSHRQDLAVIEIRPASCGAPEVLFAGNPAAATISLSHSNGRAVCAVAAPDASLGCDLEIIEPHSEGFVADYFAAEEQALIARSPASERPRLLALLWSAKESALKAMRVGLRMDTRSVIVEGFDHQTLADWSPLHTRCTHGQAFEGWWQHTGIFMRTLVAAPAAAQPIPLNTPAKSNTFAFKQISFA